MLCGLCCALMWPGLIFAGLVALLRVYSKLTVGRATSKRNLTGKTVIVTGANAGIGLETVKELLMRNARVIMACRNLQKGKAAMELALKETGANPSLLSLKQVDLSSLASVRTFAARIIAEEPRLDILINNAGLQTRKKELTSDGLEVTMAANQFGPFLLTNLLLGLMEKTPSPHEARIVNVSSAGHKIPRVLDLDNLNLEKATEANLGTKEVFALYGRTKLANVLFTRELNRKLKAAGIRNVTVNALHPGNIDTGLSQDSFVGWYMVLFRKFVKCLAKTLEEGAQTTVYVAVDAELEGVSGGYYSDCAPAGLSKLAQDDDLARKLWDVSAKLVKLQPEESVVFKKVN